jgi:predicted nucleic acid-binding protein
MARARRSAGHRRVSEAAPARYQAHDPQESLTGVLLDSDVVIEILRGRRDVVESAEKLARAGVPTYCSAVTWAEVFAGVRPGEEAATQAFFDARGEVVLDATTGRRAGSYLARYGRSHGVAIADALIAAAASTSGLRLWTRNRRHYPMDDVEFV